MNYTILQAQISNTIDKAMAYDIITTRAIDAQEYCRKYLMPHAWGRNIWISILDDAIRMRKELEASKDSKCSK